MLAAISLLHHRGPAVTPLPTCRRKVKFLTQLCCENAGRNGTRDIQRPDLCFQDRSYSEAADDSSLLPGSMFSHVGVLQLLVKRIYDWVKTGRQQRFMFQTCFDIEYANVQ